VSGPVPGPEEARDEAAAGWLAHLRSGGTTTWSAYRETGARATPDRGAPPHDAAHLELLRRLNELTGGTDPGLQDLVLATPAPGRGALDTPLPWPGEERRFGTPPLEPERLPDEELVRLATGVLARLLPGLPPVPPVSQPTRWPLPWRRRVQLHGSPATAAAVRGMLLGRGVVESWWRSEHVVLARPLEVMLAEHWAASTRAGGILTWRTLWRHVQATGLPRSIDVARTARDLADGGHRVHVVVGVDAQHVAAQAAGLLGVRESPLESGGELPQSDLLRRLNRVLAGTQPREHARDLVARLSTHVLPAVPAPDHVQAPFVPPAARAWARDAAAALAQDLTGAGYPVLGDPGVLAPRDPGPGRREDRVVDRSRTLQIALHACVAARRPEREGP
jgi:hypothetical protein